MRKIKLSVNMKPFVSRVVTDGKVQKAFAKQIGEPVGACVRGAVHKGMSGASIHKAVKDCAKGKKGTKLSY
jgi:hypothetical protein